MTCLRFITIFFCFSAITFSCKKESFITSSQAKLYTSADTLFFDTVFTSTGSITQSFKIFNGNNQKLRLSQVKLAGGASSYFKINVNGTAASEVDNIDIAANDSIYVFAQVNINPNSENLPFLIQDSILISYNGNQQFVQLQAYGQNANFLNSLLIKGNVTWNNTLPYVVLGGILVDSNAILTIQPGTRIYLHANAPFLVNGTLIANGTKEDTIVFNGDRLDPDYSVLPASWPGIFFDSSSKDNYLRHVIIKNAYQGIIAQGVSVDANPKLTISQCILTNIYDAGVLGINSSIYADNCLISNCGSNISIELGGDYRFIFCTVASNNNFLIAHNSPVLQVSNAAMVNGSTVTAPLNALFQNSIFWGDYGNVDDEITVNQHGTGPFSVTFDHILYKAKDIPSGVNFISPILNMDPMFDSINVTTSYYDFHFTNHPLSPAINSGTPTTFLLDLDDRPRSNEIPDLGCYER